jgi:hypothetical protein
MADPASNVEAIEAASAEASSSASASAVSTVTAVAPPRSKKASAAESLLATVNQAMGYNGREGKKDRYKFWETQPVAQFNESPEIASVRARSLDRSPRRPALPFTSATPCRPAMGPWMSPKQWRTSEKSRTPCPTGACIPAAQPAANLAGLITPALLRSFEWWSCDMTDDKECKEVAPSSITPTFLRGPG